MRNTLQSHSIDIYFEFMKKVWRLVIFILISSTLNAMDNQYTIIRNDNDSISIKDSIQAKEASMNIILDEAVVKGVRSLYKQKNGDIHYNVANDSYSKIATTTADILRKTPLVSIGIDGSPMIQGIKSVKILINGKEMLGITPSQVIEMISPNEISEIIVSTSPSAKFSSEGIGGIINIITTPKIKELLSGTFNMSIGTKGSHVSSSLMAFLNQKKTWSVSGFANALLGYSKITTSRELKQQRQTSESVLWSNHNTGNSFAQFYNAGVTFAYSSDYDKLDIGFRTYNQNFKLNEKKNSNSNYVLRNIHSVYDLNFSYKRSLRRYGNLNLSASSFYLPIKSLSPNGSNSNFKNSMSVYSFHSQVDFESSTFKGFQFNSGAKATKYSAYQVYDSKIKELGYQQNLYSLYFEGSKKWTSRLRSKGGLRFEYSNYRIKEGKYSWNNLFFNLSTSYDFSNRSNLTLNFNKRFNRPLLSSVLPVKQYSSPILYTIGNPNLTPAIFHKIDLSLTKYVGPNFFRFSLFGLQSNNPISSYVIYDKGVLELKSLNIDKMRSVGSNFWATLNLLKGDLNMNFGFNLVKSLLKYDPLASKGWQFDLNTNIRYRFSNGFAINYFGSLYNRRLRLQGYERQYTFSNFSIEKNFSDGKYVLAVSVDNPFSSYISENKMYHLENNMTYDDNVMYHNRGFRMMFRFRFGKNNVQQSNQQSESLLNKQL